MSELAVRGGDDAQPFARITVALILGIGILAFAAMLVLGAYAPDLRSGQDGGNHALSNGAIGLSGIVRLAEATEHHPSISRDPAKLDTADLLVITPPNGAVDVSPAVGGRDHKPTLVVLPKWDVTGDRGHRGWVRLAGLRDVSDAERVLAPRDKLTVRRVASGGRPLVSRAAPEWGMTFVAPRPLQFISGAGITPLITDADGRIVVGQLKNRLTWVVADPDLLDNIGMRRLSQARAALELLDYLSPDDADAIVFDVSLNGLGRQRSPLKLAFDPPFLALTLALAAVLLLVGWQAFARFGAARLPGRAIAFGKAALIDNTASLIKKARREAHFGGRYAETVRERAAATFGAPLHDGRLAVDAYLDRLGKGRRFSELAESLEAADSRGELVGAARAIDDWRRETGG